MNTMPEATLRKARPKSQPPEKGTAKSLPIVLVQSHAEDREAGLVNELTEKAVQG
jgi:hypothetical protein